MTAAGTTTTPTTPTDTTTYTAQIAIPNSGLTSTGFNIQIFDAPAATHVTGTVTKITNSGSSIVRSIDVLLGAYSRVSPMGTITLTGLTPSTQYMADLQFNTGYTYNGGSMRSTVQTTLAAATGGGTGTPGNNPVLSQVNFAPATANIGDTVTANIVFTGDDGLTSPSPTVNISAVGLDGVTGIGLGFGYGDPGGWYPAQHILLRPFVVTAKPATLVIAPGPGVGGSPITVTIT